MTGDMAIRPMNGRIYQEGKQLEHERESLDIPLDDHPITTQIRTQRPPPGLNRFRSHISFYHITYTRTHRRIIQLQHVALYNAYLLLFLIDALCQMASVYYDMP